MTMTTSLHTALLPPLTSLLAHTRDLLVQFPDNALLLHILVVGDRMLALPLNCGLLRALAGLEVLLAGAQAWEQVAHKGVSLQEELKPLFHLVAQWRRKEVEGWESVLEMREKVVRDKTSTWFFQLYELMDSWQPSSQEQEWLWRTSITKKRSQQIPTTTIQITELFRTLDQFLRTACLGDFLLRINLVKAFGHFSKRVKSSPYLGNMAINLALYYSQWIPDVQAHLTSCRAPIQTKLKDHVKLARWDEQNFFALRESSARSHRQIHKLARAYDEMLESAVHPILENVANRVVDAIVRVMPVLPTIHGTATAIMSITQPHAITELARICTRANKLLLQPVHNQHNLPIELHQQIVDRVTALRGENVPIQLKHRGLLDLLAGLKLHLVDLQVPEEFQDFCLLFQSLSSSSVDLKSPNAMTLLRDGDENFWTCLAHMQRLRSTLLAGHHADLQRNEMERGVSFCDRLCFMLTRQRDAFGYLPTMRRFLAGIVRTLEQRSIRQHIVSLARELGRVVLHLNLVFERWNEWTMSKHTPAPLPVDTRELDGLLAAAMEGKTTETAVIASLREIATNVLKACRVGFGTDRDARVVRFADVAHRVLLETGMDDNNNADGDPSSLVSALQVLVQAMIHGRGANDEDEASPVLTHCHGQLMKRFVAIRSACQSLYALFPVDVDVSYRIEYTNLFPRIGHPDRIMLAQLCNIVLNGIEEFSNSLLEFYVQSARLTCVVINVFRALSVKGFCRPPPSDDDDKTGGHGGMDERLGEGTGMGEGEGAKDVTEEIEDEEQLLGLKGEDQAPPPPSSDSKEKKSQEGGMEMKQDFEGEMFDVEEDGNKDDDEDDGEEEEEQELDREMGDVGENQQVVDERLWDEEEEEEKDDESSSRADEAFEENAAIKGEEMGMRAKHDQSQDKKQEQQQPKGDDEVAGEDGEEEDKDESDPHYDEAEEVEQSHGILPQGDKDDMEEEEEESVAMGEDGGEGEEKSNDDDDDDMKDLDLDPAPIENDMAPPPHDDDIDEEAMMDNGDVQQDIDGDDNDPDDAQQQQPDVEPQASASPLRTKENAQPIQQAGDQGKPGGSSSLMDAKPQKGNGVSDLMDEADLQQDPMEGNDEEEEEEKDGGEENGNKGGTKSTTANKQGGEWDEQPGMQSNDVESSMVREPNPWMDVDEAAKIWHDRLNVLQGLSQEEEHNMEEEKTAQEHATPPDTNMDINATYELADAKDESATTTLLPSSMNKPTSMSRGMQHDETILPPSSTTRRQQVEKKLPPQSKDGKQDDAKTRRNEKHRDAQPVPKDDDDDVQEMEEDDMPPPSDGFFADMMDIEDVHPQWTTSIPPPQTSVVDVANSDDDDHKPTPFPLPDTSAEERALGRETWSKACFSTADSSQRLCEQLRLLMEPTLATKLKGDYRTGKRINMRRVIPFIASKYKKDKIWLRRTKPFKRQYHIALAIDDSISMRPAGSLAVASLALIARALTRLEVGEVGVWSFGRVVRMLHALEEPFTDEAGANAAAHFKFDQESTCIEECLISVVEKLRERGGGKSTLSSSATTSPKQIAFFISDGKFDSGLRDRMRYWVRHAKEMGILIALVIVESKQSESILDLKQVTFATGGGELQPRVVMSKYLDEYPFEYYIVLRDLDVLPEVLADALKQWFELALAQQGGGG